MKLKKPIMLILAVLGGLLVLLVIYKVIAVYNDLKIESQNATENEVRKDFINPAAQTVILHLYKDEYDTATKELQNHPEVLSEKSVEGSSILSYIIWKRANPEDVRVLLAAGADPSFPEGHAPISSAAENAGVEIVKMLLEAGADPNGKSGSEPALWRAALRGNIEMMELLISNGADMDAGNGGGESPMANAAQIDHFKAVLYLLEKGASPFIADYQGYTVGTWVLESRIHPETEEGKARPRVIEVLKEKGYPWPPPDGDAVLEMQKNGEWPPKNAQ